MLCIMSKIYNSYGNNKAQTVCGIFVAICNNWSVQALSHKYTTECAMRFEGASKSSSVGVVYVSTSSSCYIETSISRNTEIAHNSKEGERYVAEGEEVSFPTIL